MHPEKAREIIAHKLSKPRYLHSLRVAEIAVEMAALYGSDIPQAHVAALLHDYAKGMSGQELLVIAEMNHLFRDEVERQAPHLLHAQVGAFLAQKELGLDDQVLVQAIAHHTLGNEKMTTLDKIIYIADMIEPGRDFPGMERLICLAYRNLDEALLFAFDTTIRLCIERNRLIHPQSVRARNYYLRQSGYSC